MNQTEVNRFKKLYQGHKDRLVPLPDLTLLGLRALWSRHRHPKLIFPNAKGSLETIQQATTNYG